jgi:hypothetical protein
VYLVDRQDFAAITFKRFGDLEKAHVGDLDHVRRNVELLGEGEIECFEVLKDGRRFSPPSGADDAEHLLLEVDALGKIAPLLPFAASDKPCRVLDQKFQYLIHTSTPKRPLYNIETKLSYSHDKINWQLMFITTIVQCVNFRFRIPSVQCLFFICHSPFAVPRVAAQ